MNIVNILTEIETKDPEVYEKLSPRRTAMKEFANFGSKVALAAMPFALGSMFKKAYGQSTNTVVDVLQFALTLEYLESEYYTTALAASGLNATLTGAARGAIQTISTHETAHVGALKATITALGATPVSKPTFDFTGGSFAGGPGTGNGPLSGANSPFTNYAVFLAVAQAFEDTGVRAYKGQAGNLISNNDVLTAALQIHSVEARHASHVRQMRRNSGLAVPAGVILKPWITLKQSGVAAPFDAYVQASYNGEEVTSQGGVDMVALTGQSAGAISEAFDEPLTKAEVLAIVDGFIV